MLARRFTFLALALLACATTSASTPPVLVSRQLAQARDLQVGDVIRLSTAPSGAPAHELRVAGIYEPQADPMRLTDRRFEARLMLDDFLAIECLAESTDDDSVQALHVALTDPADAAAFAKDLAARVPGIVALPTRDPRPDDPFAVLERFHFAIAIVTVLGSAAFLLALMVMRADERRETVGILRILGFSRRRILTEVLVEGALLAVAGAVFGVVFALVMQGAVNRFFQWRYDTPLVFLRVTPAIALRSVALAVPLGVLAGLVASWSLLRRPIGALLRR